MEAVPSKTIPVVRVFVDFWNFQITINESEARLRNVPEYRFYVNWPALGKWLADKAKNIIGAAEIDYGGCHIYGSYDPKSSEGTKHHSWITTFLNRQPGIIVQCVKRVPRALPRCPICHKQITHCPHEACMAPIVATMEKGVDTRIVTDMISLAWQDAYDVAVIASLDADLIPAVQFVQQKGKRVIQAGFPPGGTALATECWASFDVMVDRLQIQRP
jgi:hypothetical protein